MTTNVNSSVESIWIPEVVKRVYSHTGAAKPEAPTREGHTFLGWYVDATDEVTPDDFANLKAEVLEVLQAEDIDPDYAAELKQYYHELDTNVLVADGKVMVKYDPGSEFVYGDLTVHALWEESPSSGGVVGESYEVDGNVYKVISNVKDTAKLVKAKNAKKVVVPANTTINGKSYQVVAIAAKSFKSAKKSLKTVVIGKNISRIGKGAFAGCSKLKKVVVKTKKLTKKRVKGSLKNSGAKVVQVKIGKAKVNKTWAKKYDAIFTKRNCGKKVAVK